MALKKQITEDNGITLNYHKISRIDINVNNQISFLIDSYLDERFRQYEKNYDKGIDGNRKYPYIHTERVSIPYDESTDMFKGNITKKAYEWLKNQEKYKGAEDVLDG